MKKNMLIIAIIFVFIGCGTNSDGSKQSTYSSCKITESQALFAKDRTTDVEQCWDGVDYVEEHLAKDWCKKKVNEYMGRKYILGHSISWRIASTNCDKRK